MKIALVNGVRMTPIPHVKGAICPLCKTEVIAKCGEYKVHHWAHKNRTHCDQWCELPITCWHQSWKDSFPLEWWEQVVENNGEYHIADVKTERDTVILLTQKPLEKRLIQERENFFKTPVWIINASRSEINRTRLNNAQKKGWLMKPVFRKKGRKYDCWLLSAFHEGNVFRAEWLVSQFPVFLDFTCREGSDDHQNSKGNYVWCLMPFHIEGFRILYRYDKRELIEMLKKRVAQTADDIRMKMKQDLEEEVHHYLQNYFRH